MRATFPAHLYFFTRRIFNFTISPLKMASVIRTRQAATSRSKHQDTATCYRQRDCRSGFPHSNHCRTLSSLLWRSGRSDGEGHFTFRTKELNLQRSDTPACVTTRTERSVAQFVVTDRLERANLNAGTAHVRYEVNRLPCTWPCVPIHTSVAAPTRFGTCIVPSSGRFNVPFNT
jgi:hypothetical protein